ncbi:MULTISPECIES: flagellar basal body P-ring formation chaperone FlgA [Alphaproteobacteria]|uniref:flagellar basal body P-ring formation chaperone FlgA n=1 Tax=Alphaproteobacteria TaxID=28211 RepID=UPI0032636E99
MTRKMLKSLQLITAAALFGIALGIPKTATANETKGVPLFANERVMLDRESLMLSDLFIGLPAGKDARVGDAPAPGENMVVRLSTLRKLSTIHGLDWTPPHNRIRVAVQREGRAVPLQLVREAIAERLQQDYVADNIDVELTNRRLTLMIPADMPPEISVDNIDYNSQNQRFAASISVPISNSKVIRAQVQGEVYPVIEVPVLSRHAAPGETIHASDIVWTEMRARRSNYNTVTSADQLVGMSARRPISAGRVIRRTDVKPIELIHKGDLVTMIFRTSFMTLTLRGQALESGARNDTIRVKNLSSGKTVVGSITQSGIVSVAGPRLAMN